MSGHHNLPIRFCPQCEHTVSLVREMSGGVEVFKCCNCWALHLTLDELDTQPHRRQSDAVIATHR